MHDRSGVFYCVGNCKTILREYSVQTNKTNIWVKSELSKSKSLYQCNYFTHGRLYVSRIFNNIIFSSRTSEEKLYLQVLKLRYFS